MRYATQPRPTQSPIESTAHNVSISYSMPDRCSWGVLVRETAHVRGAEMMSSGLMGAMHIGAIVAADLSDHGADRRIYLVVAGLAVLGIGMTAATVWWWRTTRPEAPALGPLEVMSDKQWRTASDAEQQRLLAEHRPVGAPAPVDQIDRGEPIDLDEHAAHEPTSFDDLRDEPVESSLSVVDAIIALPPPPPPASAVGQVLMPIDDSGRLRREITWPKED